MVWRLRGSTLFPYTTLFRSALVEWLGAVQAQDFAAAKWALGLRLQGVKDDDIEQAFTDGAILRTHVMRPTWHFVDRKSTRLNSSHRCISYAVFCLKKKKSIL